jgi:phosphoenolpyruvate-protein kinase (PTS system EI component)
VVFPSLGALVTDGGGILSHPAIIAREHGIPAVVGTGNATAILRDGQRVTVDGGSGVVEPADGATEVALAGLRRIGLDVTSKASGVDAATERGDRWQTPPGPTSGLDC